MIYIFKLILFFLLVIACTFFFIVRHRIIVRLEKNHIDAYKKLFVTIEGKGTEIEETFLWRDFTADGYKNLNDKFLARLVRQHKVLGMSLVGLFILLMCLLCAERYLT